MTPPARPAAPAPPAHRRLGHAPRPVLAAAARALRRHVHPARRPPRPVGDRLAPRRRQAGLHRRPERAARGRGQRDPQAAARRRSVLLLDGPEHMAERKALLPPFHGERMQAYGELIREIAEREVATLADRRADRHPPAHAGADARDDHARRLRHPRRARCARRCARMLDCARPTRAADVRRARAAAPAQRASFSRDARADRRAAERADRRAAAPRPTSTSARTSSRCCSRTPTWTTRRLRDELLTLLVRRPRDDRDRARLGARAARASPAARGSGCAAATRTTSTPSCKETLRLRPVVPAVIRMLKAPFEIAGYELPAGVAVVPNILLVHTREDVYPDPFAFRPERFLETARRHLHVDPVRRRRAPLPRRELRAVRDEGRAARGRRRGRGARARPAAAPSGPTRRAVTLVPRRDGRVIVARRAAPARRAQPVPSGR